MTYFDDLVSAKNSVVTVLEQKGIEPNYLTFGGAGDTPAKPPRVLNDARSEFLANRAMGDWAEKILAAAIRASRPDWQVSHYGDTNSIAAGEEGFKTGYLAGLDEVRQYGKRPDLLLFPRNLNVSDDISTQPFVQVDALVKDAIGALEVRSSKFEALKYMAVRAQEREAGKSSGREFLSFTVKVEDLKIVYRWIERYRKPQAYVQVFFDSVFMINVLRIFQIIGSGGRLVVDTPAKSQEKSTIMIPVDSGQQVGTLKTPPEFTARQRVTRLGRHDAYVVPVGGELQLQIEHMEALLMG